MTWDDVVALGLESPGVETSTSYGAPALRVAKKLLTRFLPKEDAVVLFETPQIEREALTEARPAVFFLTPHYRDHDIVLARLSAADSADIAPFLLRRWRSVVPKRFLRARDAGRAGRSARAPLTAAARRHM